MMSKTKNIHEVETPKDATIFPFVLLLIGIMVVMVASMLYGSIK